MADNLAHRGPDGSGVWVDAVAGIGLGHRRLAIIDLSSAGHQPMLSASGRLVMVYNGEIYNYAEIRMRLEVEGHNFRGRSDSEVLLEACDNWGVERTLKQCVGMFAFALWDRTERSLTLVRDRLGIKPLYWGRQGRHVLFASQPRAIAACETWHRDTDPQALDTYLRLAYVPAPQSIYLGLMQLRPGHLLVVRADGSLQERCYWDLARLVAGQGPDRIHAIDPREATEELDRLMRKAVRARMISDVPIGAFLSGGIDSSTVTALMQAQCMQPVKTFSIGFSDDSYDEARSARAVAKHLGTDHTELYAKPEHALELVPKLPDFYDEPFADSSQLATLLVCALARKHVTVALSGDGGDEVFAGYNRYLVAGRIRMMFSVLPTAARRTLATMIRNVSPQTWDRIFGVVSERWRPRLFGDKLHKFAEVLRLPELGHVYRQLVSLWPSNIELVPGAHQAPFTGDCSDGQVELFPDRMQLIDTLSYLPGDILTKIDRASMSYGLEARVPLLDHRVIEYAWSLPTSLKIRGGQSKWILREVLYRYVPRTLVDRPKMGFAVPIESWLRGPLREWADELLSERALRDAGLFNPNPIRERWLEHRSGARNWQHPLWCVLMAQLWRRRWIG